jgi:hypothetical protein
MPETARSQKNISSVRHKMIIQNFTDGLMYVQLCFHKNKCLLQVFETSTTNRRFIRSRSLQLIFIQNTSYFPCGNIN